MKKPSYVLDSFALLAYFQADPGGEKVRNLLKEASTGKATAYLSVINLGEVLYITERKLGQDMANNTLEDIFRLPVQLADASTERVVGAAHVKAGYAISYADAFVVALAQELEATIITADPEFQKVESLTGILWL